ncbi:hypothetical protein CDL12_14465 [Handroanthus impetiginosus]|uniref:Epidermal patterning factor-like protein n=1 Tax=Handroanthus impetiginosus TaxID=429701 RepID=A0A2G9H5X0_9LAMI|nr:hypothetical protein CDL12_14465 [Handroanthus impetiginosus]
MAMASFTPLISSNSIALFITLFLLIISPSYCLNTNFRGLLVEEKARLGSMPPSCYNKCNQCQPCTAEQVPTLPSHHRFEPGSVEEKRYDSARNRYSNYKPLGWKCRCGGHLYNP